MILIKHFKNSVHISLVLSKKNNNKFNFFDFLRIFFVRFFYAFSSIRNLKKMRNISDNIFKENYFEDNINLQEILHMKRARTQGCNSWHARQLG